MDASETIESWKWRIVKSGHNVASFSKLINVPHSDFSQYFKRERMPSLKRYNAIENKLKELGV